MRAYFDALAVDSSKGLVEAWFAMTDHDKLLVVLCWGGIGREQFGFRAEVGRG